MFNYNLIDNCFIINDIWANVLYNESMERDQKFPPKIFFKIPLILKNQKMNSKSTPLANQGELTVEF